MPMRFLLFSLLLINSLLAIVSIQPRDVGEKPSGLSGDLAFSLNGTRGNTENNLIDTGASLQYDFNNSLIFFNGSYKYGVSLGIKNVDSAFYHLRNIHKLSKHFDDELFVQEQNNAFLDLTSRTIAGAGIRYSAGDSNTTGKFYLGLGAFNVTEKEIGTNLTNFNRTNIYFSYKYTPSKTTTLALVNYYQPKFTDASDYLQFSTLEFTFGLTSNLAFVITSSFKKDSKPAAGIESYDYSQSTALKYKF